MAVTMIHANRGQIVTNIKPAIDNLISLSIDVLNPSIWDKDHLVGGTNESVTFFLTPEQVNALVGNLYGQLLIKKVKEYPDA